MPVSSTAELVADLVTHGGDLLDVADRLDTDPIDALHQVKEVAPNLVSMMLGNRKPGFRSPVVDEVRDICETLVQNGRDFDDATAEFKVSRQTLRAWLLGNGMGELYVDLMRNRPDPHHGVGRPRVYTRSR